MKILDKTIFKRKNEEINIKNKKLEILQKEYENVCDKSRYNYNKVKELENKNLALMLELEENKVKIKKLNNAKGGFTKHVNRLSKINNDLLAKLRLTEKELKETQNKLTESMSGKYLVRKVKTGRTPNATIMGIKRINTNAQVQKTLKEKAENQEK